MKETHLLRSSKWPGWTVGVAALGAWAALRAMKKSRFPLRGQAILIAGGSRGLGLALAREAARQGAKLALCARDGEELERARGDLASLTSEVLTLPCDLTRQSEVEQMVGNVRERFGSIDVLINNAGIIQVGPAETMTVDDFVEAMNTHFWGPLYTTLAVVDGMRARRSGRIVNICSIGGKLSVPHLLPYCASKFALAGLSEGFRVELAKDGISVTSVFPGLMQTGSPLNATFKGRHRAEYAWFSAGDAMPFVSMRPETAARKILTAARLGSAELVLGWPAKLAVSAHALMPGFTQEALRLVNRLLPQAGHLGKGRALGRQSESTLTPSWARKAIARAASRHNERP